MIAMDMNGIERVSWFEVGDTVTIRDWSDMLNEYGAADYSPDCINTIFAFIPEMLPFCGKQFRISSISWENEASTFEYKLRNMQGRGHRSKNDAPIDFFSFTEQMFESIDWASNDDVEESSKINLFLGVHT